MVCEMCGIGGYLVTAVVEGSELRVCKNCSSYGSVLTQRQSSPARLRVERPELVLVENFASQLRAARERRSLSNEDFAQMLQEKESVVAKWELGVLRPSLPVAQRVGKLLGLRLVGPEKEREPVVLQKSKVVATLGDMIKVRTRSR